MHKHKSCTVRWYIAPFNIHCDFLRFHIIILKDRTYVVEIPPIELGTKHHFGDHPEIVDCQCRICEHSREDRHVRHGDHNQTYDSVGTELNE